MSNNFSGICKRDCTLNDFYRHVCWSQTPPVGVLHGVTQCPTPEAYFPRPEGVQRRYEEAERKLAEMLEHEYQSSPQQRTKKVFRELVTMRAPTDEELLLTIPTEIRAEQSLKLLKTKLTKVNKTAERSVEIPMPCGKFPCGFCSDYHGPVKSPKTHLPDYSQETKQVSCAWIPAHASCKPESLPASEIINRGADCNHGKTIRVLESRVRKIPAA
jgi:hypothetical protein